MVVVRRAPIQDADTASHQPAPVQMPSWMWEQLQACAVTVGWRPDGTVTPPACAPITAPARISSREAQRLAEALDEAASSFVTEGDPSVMGLAADLREYVWLVLPLLRAGVVDVERHQTPL